MTTIDLALTQHQKLHVFYLFVKELISEATKLNLAESHAKSSLPHDPQYISDRCLETIKDIITVEYGMKRDELFLKYQNLGFPEAERFFDSVDVAGSVSLSPNAPYISISGRNLEHSDIRDVIKEIAGIAGEL